MPSGPKNKKYTNRHAVEAQERNAERSQKQENERKKMKEDAEWRVSDKNDLKYQEKQQKQAEKAAEQARRQAEKKEQLLLEEKEASNKVPSKVAQRQLQRDMYKQTKEYDKAYDAMRRLPTDEVVESISTSVSRSLDSSPVEKECAREDAEPGSFEMDGINDRNIGKRARVLYKAFYEENYELVKEEKPGLRRTQYNNMVWDRWQKCPSNPFVMRSELRSQTRLEMERKWIEEGTVYEEENE